jgi:hypothetical protein
MELSQAEGTQMLIVIVLFRKRPIVTLFHETF